MLTDLLNAISGDVMLGLAQAGAAIALCAAVVALGDAHIWARQIGSC